MSVELMSEGLEQSEYLANRAPLCMPDYDSPCGPDDVCEPS